MSWRVTFLPEVMFLADVNSSFFLFQGTSTALHLALIGKRKSFVHISTLRFHFFVNRHLLRFPCCIQLFLALMPAIFLIFVAAFRNGTVLNQRL
jgi:hypothetical protein